MPLRLHHSSCCDVCLDAYSLDSPDKAPSAIPCGHVFCRECLTAIIPPNCPLCRKPFLADRIKRIHVDVDISEETEDKMLLQRLLELWGERDPELKAQFNELFEKTQAYVDSRDDGGDFALRQAMDMMGKYLRLKERRKQDHQTIKRFEAQIRDQDIQVAQFKDISHNMERSLLQQVTTLQNQLSRTQDEVRTLRVEASNTHAAEVISLRAQLAQYEEETDGIRLLTKQVKQYENEIKQLRMERSHPSYPFNHNPLPPPLLIRPYDGVPSLAEAIASNKNKALFSAFNDNPTTSSQINGQTPSVHSNGSNPTTLNSKHDKKSKGKAREQGPSYQLSTSHPDSINIQTPKAQPVGLVPGAYTQHRVVPKSPQHNSLPPPPHPPQSNGTNPIVQHTEGEHEPYGLDPYALTAAYVSEYAKGYSTGYQLAEYTSGTEAAVVDDFHNQPNYSRAPTSMYSQNHDNDRHTEMVNKTPRPTNSVYSAMINTPTKPSTISLVRETESRDSGSYTINTPRTTIDIPQYDSYDVEVGSLSNSTRLQGRRRSSSKSVHSINDTSDQSMRVNASNTDSQDAYTIDSSRISPRTRESALQGYTSDVSSVSLLSNSTHSQGHRRGNSQVIQDSYQVGRGLPSNLSSSMNATRPRNERRISMPTPRHPTSNGFPTSTVLTANTTAQVITGQSDNDSVRSSRTQETIQSWGTVRTMDSWSGLTEHSTGGSVGDLGLLNFQSPDEASGNENGNSGWDRMPSALLGPSNSNLNTPRNGSATQDHSFPLRESDDERTPMSGTNRSLVSAASSTSSFPRLETLNIHGRPIQNGQDRERGRDRDRERERERERERMDTESERSERRRSAYPTSPSQVVTSASEPGTRHTQMMSVSDYTSAQQSRVPHTADARYSSNSNQHYLDQMTSSTHTQPAPSSHTSISSSNRSHGHSQSRRERDAPARRLSMSTAGAATSPPNTAPESNSWTEMGYYTDGPSRATYSSPTVVDSSSGSNALGLDGLDDPTPLQISAPRPIASSRSFLRSFSYDTYS